MTILLSLSPSSPTTAIDPEKAGPYAVGTTRFELAAHDARQSDPAQTFSYLDPELGRSPSRTMSSPSHSADRPL